MEKNQAAIDAGRYEMDRRQFFKPEDFDQFQSQPAASGGQQQQQQQEGPAGTAHSVNTATEPSAEKASSRQRLGNLFKRTSSSGTGIPAVEPEADLQQQQKTQPPPQRPRARLQKRSDSRLSVVGE